MKTKQRVQPDYKMTSQATSPGAFRMLYPEDCRVRIALAVYDPGSRRYREKVTFKFRVNEEKELDALIEKVKEKIEPLGVWGKRENY